MKVFALLCLVVASATPQSQSSHFQIRGGQSQNQQSSGFGSDGRSIQNNPSSTLNRLSTSQSQQGTSQNQGSGFRPSTRAGSRFQTSVRGQEVISEQQRIQSLNSKRPQSSIQQSQRPSSLQSQRPSSFQSQKPSSFQSQKPSSFQSQKPSSFQSQKPSSLQSQRPSSFQSQRPSSSQSQRPSSLQSQRPSSLQSQRPSSLQSQRPSSLQSQRPSSTQSQRPSSGQSQSSQQRTQSQQSGQKTQTQSQQRNKVSSLQKTSSQSKLAAKPTSKPATEAPASTGSLLSLPDPEQCKTRPKQWQFNGINYYFSWDQNDIDPVTKEPRKVDWLEARNACRKKCMDSIGIETEAENNMVLKFMTDRKLRYVWTSGRLCDFTGCAQRRDLHPISVFGWFWSDTNTKAAPTNSTPPGWLDQPWSQKGHVGGPQPDNAEFDINRTPESCLAVLNDIYKDGIKWHDIACYHKKPYICEDSKLLLDYVKATNVGIVL